MLAALSPVLLPETEVVPVTERVGVELPVKVIPFTDVGVMAPATIVKAGVAPPVDEPENPFALAMETAVTVPVPAAAYEKVPEPLLKRNPLVFAKAPIEVKFVASG